MEGFFFGAWKPKLLILRHRGALVSLKKSLTDLSCHTLLRRPRAASVVVLSELVLRRCGRVRLAGPAGIRRGVAGEHTAAQGDRGHRNEDRRRAPGLISASSGQLRGGLLAGLRTLLPRFIYDAVPSSEVLVYISCRRLIAPPWCRMCAHFETDG